MSIFVYREEWNSQMPTNRCCIDSASMDKTSCLESNSSKYSLTWGLMQDLTLSFHATAKFGERSAWIFKLKNSFNLCLTFVEFSKCLSCHIKRTPLCLCSNGFYITFLPSRMLYDVSQPSVWLPIITWSSCQESSIHEFPGKNPECLSFVVRLVDSWISL